MNTATPASAGELLEAQAVEELIALAPLSEFCLVGKSIFFIDSEGYWSNALIENQPFARFAYRFLVRNGTPYLDSTDELCALIKRDWHPSEPLAMTVASAAKAMLKFEKVERLAAKLRELGVDPDAI